MSGKVNVYAVKGFLGLPGEGGYVKRGTKLSMDDKRAKELKANGLVADKMPAKAPSNRNTAKSRQKAKNKMRKGSKNKAAGVITNVDKGDTSRPLV